MAWFKIFPDNRVDDEIFELYRDIEILLAQNIQLIQEYFKEIVKTEYYDSHYKDKKYYSITEINNFLNRLREDYGRCYSMKMYKNNYDFEKSHRRTKEKKQIVEYLKKLIKLLTAIYDEMMLLDKSHIEHNDLIKLSKKIGELVDKETIYEKLRSENEEMVIRVLSKILKESDENESKGLWLITYRKMDQKIRMRFSQSLSIQEINYLELISVLNIKGLSERNCMIKKIDRRSLLARGLHKDRTLPMLHYNVFINNKNIHVIPKNYANRIKQYIIIDSSPLSNIESNNSSTMND